MNSALHLLHLQPAPSQRDSESVKIVTHDDAGRGIALFRSPAFPTPHQFFSELPFTVNFARAPKPRD